MFIYIDIKLAHISICTHISQPKFWSPLKPQTRDPSTLQHKKHHENPSKIEWDLTNGPLSKLLELLDTQV